jgi:hypothetical protein
VASRAAANLWLTILCTLPALWSQGRCAWGQQLPAVTSGVQYLKAHARGQQAGESAMIALALLKAEVPGNDPAVISCVERFKTRLTTGSYSPERSNGQSVYEAAAMVLALSNLDVTANRGDITTLAGFLASAQKANGSWDYTDRQQGDTSISQYAVLGLWEAENAGVDVSPSVWDNAAQWFMSAQSTGGSWNYHRDNVGSPETISMTAAGVGSLLICQRQLERFRAARRGTSALMTSLVSETPGARSGADYKVQTSPARFKEAIDRGLRWISSNFSPSNPNVMGPSTFYGLYGIERVGALSDRDKLGRADWYEQGKSFIVGSQQTNGSWNGAHGTEMNTVWAILFLTKSTKKTIQRITIKQLGAGTLLGGRYLPKDLTAMTVAGGRVVSRPMNGAVDGMISILEDPRAEKAEAAFAGLVERYYAEGPKALVPHKARFRKMEKSRDPGVRAVAVWALARTGELDVVPDLIAAITDRDDQVVTTARMGLQLISRKLDGPGPPEPSTLEQRQAAAGKWREWFAAIRPLDLSDPSDIPTSSGTNEKTKPDQAAGEVTP